MHGGRAQRRAGPGGVDLPAEQRPGHPHRGRPVQHGARHGLRGGARGDDPLAPGSPEGEFEREVHEEGPQVLRGSGKPRHRGRLRGGHLRLLPGPGRAARDEGPVRQVWRVHGHERLFQPARVQELLPEDVRLRRGGLPEHRLQRQARGLHLPGVQVLWGRWRRRFAGEERIQRLGPGDRRGRDVPVGRGLPRQEHDDQLLLRRHEHGRGPEARHGPAEAVLPAIPDVLPALVWAKAPPDHDLLQPDDGDVGFEHE
mmetsp:Transcript_80733/g.210596  ORF Transcript_80733/g.210596 Transcript_80733/m.210596 type:complete len:256 (-) Transcript_80733:847-1614(-)